MDDAFGVRGGERLRDLNADVDRLAHRQQRARDPLAQRFPFEQLQNDERRTVVPISCSARMFG